MNRAASKKRLQYIDLECIMKKCDLLEQTEIQHKGNCVVGGGIAFFPA